MGAKGGTRHINVLAIHRIPGIHHLGAHVQQELVLDGNPRAVKAAVLSDEYDAPTLCCELLEGVDLGYCIRHRRIPQEDHLHVGRDIGEGSRCGEYRLDRQAGVYDFRSHGGVGGRRTLGGERKNCASRTPADVPPDLRAGTSRAAGREAHEVLYKNVVIGNPDPSVHTFVDEDIDVVEYHHVVRRHEYRIHGSREIHDGCSCPKEHNIE